MSLLIPQLVPCPFVSRAEDKDLLCHLTLSTTAAEEGRHRENSGLEQKRIQVIYSHFQLDSQQALCFSKPLMKPQDIGPQGASIKLGLGGLLAKDCHCYSQRAEIVQLALVEMVAGHWGSS
jgi:hypothetical protein